MNTINYFSSFTGLKPNLSKCEVADIGGLKGFKVAICGIKRIDLTKEAIKILGVLFSYDKNLQLENNFRKTMLNVGRILRMWRQRNLNTGGQSNFFQNISFIKNCILGTSFINSKSDYRRIVTNTKRFLMEFIFSENEM